MSEDRVADADVDRLIEIMREADPLVHPITFDQLAVLTRGTWRRQSSGSAANSRCGWGGRIDLGIATAA